MSTILDYKKEFQFKFSVSDELNNKNVHELWISTEKANLLACCSSSSLVLNITFTSCEQIIINLFIGNQIQYNRSSIKKQKHMTWTHRDRL